MAWDRTKVYKEATYNMHLHQQFWADFMVQLQPRWSKEVDTAGVCQAPDGINVMLYMNEDFLMKIGSPPNPNYKVYPVSLLTHEVMHVGFAHHLSMADYKHKDIFNLAADCLVNSYIPKKDLPVWTDEKGNKFEAVTVDSFPELKMEPKKDTRYYYDKLVKAHEEKSCPNLEGMLSQMSRDGFGDTPWEHKTWKSFQDMTDADKALMSQQTGQALATAFDRLPDGHKDRGLLPGEITEIIERIKNPAPPKFNWKGFLRNFVNNSEVCGMRRTRRKDNERYPDNPALKVLHKKRVLVGIDTSGSVSNEELMEFMGEMEHIHKCGTDITVVQCDTVIRSVEKFKPRMDITFHGRGGTILTPVLEYFTEHRKEFTCLIFFTDGGCEPTPDWFHGRCLWVLSNRSSGYGSSHLKPYVIALEK
jgi:predicted metal-dependent peptidase